MLRRGTGIALVMALTYAPAPLRAESEFEPEPDVELEASATSDVALEAPEPHYLRASIELAMALGIGTGWYWADRERQVADWDFPSWEERLSLDVLRYDNNPFRVNHSWHTFSGSVFHLAARSNDISFAKAAAMGMGTSLIWEYAFEYREKVSVNDILFTPGSGIVVGEFVHLLGRLATEHPTLSRAPLLKWMLGPMHTAHESLDGSPRSGQRRTPIWYDVDLSVSTAGASSERIDSIREIDGTSSFHELNFDARFIHLPGFDAERSQSIGFYTGGVSSASVAVGLGDDAERTDARAEIYLAGQYRKLRSAGSASELTTLVGVPLAYMYRREEIGVFRDRLGILHLPGLGGDISLTMGDVRADFAVRAHADFVGVHAMSNQDWNQAHPDVQGKAILRKQGYYYGWGGSAKLEASLAYRGLSAGAKLWVAHYESHEGLDRTQEDVELDVSSQDDVLDHELWVRIGQLPYDLFVEGSYLRHDRVGQLGEFSAEQRLRSASLRLGVEL